MPTKLNPETVKTDAEKILGVWKTNTGFTMQGVTLESFETDGKQLDALIKQIEAKESEITPVRNERDDLTRKLKEICTRARSGIRGYFGLNSSQYEQAGGTRASERKKPRRRSGKGKAAQG